MGDYKKISIFLNDDLYQEIEKLLRYRNAKYEFLGEDKKSRSIEEFVTGSVIEALKKVKRQENLGEMIIDLNKSFKLKNRFKELMIKRKWKQKYLSDLTGVDPGNISKILSNENQPSLENFMRLWVAFGCLPFNEVLYREE
jgi:hypothetical protein